MQLSKAHIILAFTIVLTLIPYSTLEIDGLYSISLTSHISLITLQLLSISFIIFAYLHANSRSIRLFWQFLALAIISALISTVWLFGAEASSAALLRNFFSLFSYFFILLAIETNPHLSETPVNKYIGGRVPAIFFTVTCFSYFVLFPTEFPTNNQPPHLPSALFHLTISTLIFIRLTLCVFSCDDKSWRYTYILLAIGALSILIRNISDYLTNGSDIISISYFTTVLTLLPYCALIFAAYSSLLTTSLAVTSNKSTYPELYILTLVVSLLMIHGLGVELNLYYITSEHWQSLAIGIWTIIAFTLIILITQNKRQYTLRLKNQLKQQQQQQNEMAKLNVSLCNSIINSEDKAIVHASNNAILTTTVNGKILSANPAAVQMFQSIEHELKGANVSTFFSPDDQMHYFFNFKSNVYSLQRKDVGISVECIARRSDGTNFPVQAELQWADREEQPLIVITFINLTARKLAEKQTLDLKDKFIANISHEFRTPLTIINGILDRYLSKAKTMDEGKELTTAKRNGLRLVRMVEQLLELSRLTDNPHLSISTYRLHSLMAMPLDSFSRLAKQNNLQFEAQVPTDLWLECDAQAFEKIIFNLLANAIKYTPSGGKVNVNVYCEQETIILDIIDTGIGINPASQVKIFERFQRAEDENNHGVFGVGIGLSLVNELVKAHNWRINLVSEYNQGSKFSLSIPQAAAIDIETKTPISISENEVSSLLIEQNTINNAPPTHSQKVVLVIEDNLDMQTHIKQVIEQQHHCILAISGELGLTLAQEYIPDLIVCDIMLTGIDGFEVLKQLKENELTAHIPVILLTARSDLESRLHGLNLQADEYLSKPFNQQELLIRIENLIKNRKQLQQTYLNKFTEHQKEVRKETCVKNVSLLTESEGTKQTVDEKFLLKLEAIVAKYYMETDLGIDHLASEMAMSERQLQRKMKVLLGTTPNNFIKEFRLTKAMELLKNGSQVGRIALDVGFSSQTYFGRCFKETFNCTPKQYQQDYLQR